MFKKKTDKNNNSALWLALPIMLIAFLVLYFIVNLTNVTSFIDGINAILSPIFIGLVIAYLMNPIFRLFENKVFRWKKDTAGKRRICRLLSLLCTLIVFFAIIALLILLIFPQLIDSIIAIVTNHEHYIRSIVDFTNNLCNSVINQFSYDESREIISYDAIHNYLHSIFEADEGGKSQFTIFIEKYSQQLTDMGTGIVMSIFTFLKDFVIGIFIAFYILASKELRGAQIKKMRKALFSREQNKFISEVQHISKNCFGGYIKGKLLSSLVVGILTYLALVIFNISDYKLLIATIICITDIIPIFGPFIGAIPSAIIVLMCDPSKLLPFVLIILIIQQIEGNIISPKILGDSTNISSLAVIIAITTMGGLFGIIGMVIGVPVFATVIIVTKRMLEKKLKEKGLPTETEDYMGENSMSDTDIILHKQEGTLINKIKHSIKERREKKTQKAAAAEQNQPEKPEDTANTADKSDKTVDTAANADSDNTEMPQGGEENAPEDTPDGENAGDGEQ